MFCQDFRPLFLLFSPVCQQHGVRLVPQEVFLAVSDLACAHTVGFGSVISPDKLMVSVHSVGPVGVIWFVLRLSLPMLWFCLNCLTVSFWSLSRSPYWMHVMLGWFPRACPYILHKCCLCRLPARSTYTDMICCASCARDVPNTSLLCFLGVLRDGTMRKPLTRTCGDTRNVVVWSFTLTVEIVRICDFCSGPILAYVFTAAIQHVASVFITLALSVQKNHLHPIALRLQGKLCFP